MTSTGDNSLGLEVGHYLYDEDLGFGPEGGLGIRIDGQGNVTPTVRFTLHFP
jgi:hypothetical protein